jgi:hypothetical protein
MSKDKGGKGSLSDEKATQIVDAATRLGRIPILLGMISFAQ